MAKRRDTRHFAISPTNSILCASLESSPRSFPDTRERGYSRILFAPTQKREGKGRRKERKRERERERDLSQARAIGRPQQRGQQASRVERRGRAVRDPAGPAQTASTALPTRSLSIANLDPTMPQ
jgi:hypothetical protein